MIKKGFQRGKIASLFLLLGLILILPYGFIGWQNKHLLNQVEKEVYQMPSLPNDILSGRPLTRVEKLYLVSNENNGNGVSIVETYKEPDKMLKERLMEQFSGVLTALQDTSAMPCFARLGKPKVTALSKVKITDQSLDYGWVELWDMTVTYQNASVKVLMDDKDPLFYSLFVSTAFLESRDTNFSTYLETLDADIRDLNSKDGGSTETFSETHYEMGLSDYQVVYSVESSPEFFRYYPVEVKRIR